MTYLIALALLLIATPALAQGPLQSNLNWVNPTISAGNPAPTNILVQKAAAIGGPFTTLHTLASTATTDSDTAIVLGTPVCYQLIWVYPLGNSVPLGPQCATPAVGPAGTLLNIQFSKPPAP